MFSDQKTQKTNNERSLIVAGIDEAGRGPLAGPVTAACVVLPQNASHPLIKDSKKLSDKVREELSCEIKTRALAYSVVSVGPRRIDKLNILQATRLAMSLAAKRVYQSLGMEKLKFFHLLIDGNSPIEPGWSQETIIKGDSKIQAISAASILAKVSRDKLMKILDKHYPEYNFARHKGYPTSLHIEKVEEFGPSPVHRKTFAPVAKLL